MTKRIPVALASMLVSMFVAFPAIGQTSNPSATAAVDLNARLKAAEENPRQLELNIKAGSKTATFCANCHGNGGNSVKPDVPNLAGQNAAYLLEQMRQFSDGQRISSDFKKRLINVLSPDEKVSLIVFYSRQDVIHKPSADPALVMKGKALYRDTCADCHEDNGRGTEKYARVAGQQTGYLTRTLKGYRDGSHARINHQMAVSVRDMTDADIAAVVAYVSSMK